MPIRARDLQKSGSALSGSCVWPRNYELTGDMLGHIGDMSVRTILQCSAQDSA